MLGCSVVFYVVLFSALAVLLVVAGLTLQSRNRRQLQAERHASGRSAAQRRVRSEKRARSRDARRKRG